MRNLRPNRIRINSTICVLMSLKANVSAEENDAWRLIVARRVSDWCYLCLHRWSLLSRVAGTEIKKNFDLFTDKSMALHQRSRKNRQFGRRTMVNDYFSNVALPPIPHRKSCGFTMEIRLKIRRGIRSDLSPIFYLRAEIFPFLTRTFVESSWPSIKMATRTSPRWK